MLPKVLVFAGSIRTGSMNARLAALASKELLDAGADVTRISLADYELPIYDEAIKSMLLMMAPFTPFIAEELWAYVGGQYSILQQSWPVYDPEAAKAEEITLVVQVNGKLFKHEPVFVFRKPSKQP